MQRQWRALPAAAPNRLRVRPKTPPTATGSQPHCAHSMMGLASSPRHHLRPSTAHYDAPRFWRGHERGLISPCASLAVPAKGCKPAGCCAGLICWAYALRTGQRRGRRGLYAADGAAARRSSGSAAAARAALMGQHEPGGPAAAGQALVSRHQPLGQPQRSGQQLESPLRQL